VGDTPKQKTTSTGGFKLGTFLVRANEAGNRWPLQSANILQSLNTV